MVEPIGTFRNTLKSSRGKLKLTVTEVRELLDLVGVQLSERQYFRYEKGQVYPPVNIAQALAGVLCVPVSELWPNDLSKGDKQ